MGIIASYWLEEPRGGVGDDLFPGRPRARANGPQSYKVMPVPVSAMWSPNHPNDDVPPSNETDTTKSTPIRIRL